MATNRFQGFPTHPGEAGLYSPSSYHFLPGANNSHPFPYMAANQAARMAAKKIILQLGAGNDYLSTMFGTVTTTGTGAAAAASTDEGVLLTCGSDSTFNTNLESKRLWTPVADKIVVCGARIVPSDITTVGWEFNIGNSQVDPATTNYTDVIGLKMAVGAGTVIGKVRGNSGTQSVTSTLYTMTAATEAYFGFFFSLNATAGSVAGGFFYGASADTVSYTGFSSAQRTQAAAILTTPPSVFCNLHAKGSAGNPTVLFKMAFAQVDL